MRKTDSSHREPQDVSPTPKDLKRVHSSRNPVTLIEESVVNLHALCIYHEDELTDAEFQFLQVAKRNLASMHRRLSGS